MTDAEKTPAADRKSDTDREVSPAGSHHKPELTDNTKTPGSGMLPDDDSTEVEGPSG